MDTPKSDGRTKIWWSALLCDCLLSKWSIIFIQWLWLSPMTRHKVKLSTTSKSDGLFYTLIIRKYDGSIHLKCNVPLIWDITSKFRILRLQILGYKWKSSKLHWIRKYALFPLYLRLPPYKFSIYIVMLIATHFLYKAVHTIMLRRIQL